MPTLDAAQLAGMQETLASMTDATLVNGQATFANWAEAQPNRIQTFLNESEWGKPTYEVSFPDPAVLKAPFNLKDGSELIWSVTGQRFVVRRFSPDTSNDTLWACSVIVVAAGGS